VGLLGAYRSDGPDTVLVISAEDVIFFNCSSWRFATPRRSRRMDGLQEPFETTPLKTGLKVSRVNALQSFASRLAACKVILIRSKGWWPRRQEKGPKKGPSNYGGGSRNRIALILLGSQRVTPKI
jgi:hypothetical protein